MKQNLDEHDAKQKKQSGTIKQIKIKKGIFGWQ